MTEDHNVLKEHRRLNALHKLKVLDSPFETIFDSVTRLLSDVCGTPMALITLVDDNRNWFKANVGLENILETPRQTSFCNHTIETETLLEINDATQDERFWDNPLVIGNPEIRFYCGVPITLPMGENIGAICVLDTKPNYLNECQRKTIVGLAKLVSQLLVLREINLKRSEPGQ